VSHAEISEIALVTDLYPLMNSSGVIGLSAASMIRVPYASSAAKWTLSPAAPRTRE
jgi:hypothetical protein